MKPDRESHGHYWVSRIKASRDLRLRYEGIYNREERQTDGSTKDLDDRNRYRIRARLFFDAPITEETSTHFMICSNQDSNRGATTTNQTFTNDFNDKGIYQHRAYATYKPKSPPIPKRISSFQSGAIARPV
jgi:hypothetical protein